MVHVFESSAAFSSALAAEETNIERMSPLWQSAEWYHPRAAEHPYCAVSVVPLQQPAVWYYSGTAECTHRIDVGVPSQ